MSVQCRLNSRSTSRMRRMQCPMHLRPRFHAPHPHRRTRTSFRTFRRRRRPQRLDQISDSEARKGYSGKNPTLLRYHHFVTSILPRHTLPTFIPGRILQPQSCIVRPSMLLIVSLITFPKQRQRVLCYLFHITVTERRGKLLYNPRLLIILN